MQTYDVNLECPVVSTFRTQRAADSVALDIAKKCKHQLSVTADLSTDFNVGLIVGSSGSGKTTLARKVYGEESMTEILDMSKPIIDQFKKSMTYDECASQLTGVGLTSIPCWIRPAYTLSNGQKARAEAALQMASDKEQIVIDEFTSVVDRTVAKVMSHSIQKHARKNKKRVILVACHRDIVEWLNPDWIIDCNTQTYENRRSMVGSHVRTDQLRLDVKRCDRNSWKSFSKYHYLSQNLPGGNIYTFGLFCGNDQIGFQCFANYNFANRNQYHSNRVVIHPDYVGLGIGIDFATETSKVMVDEFGLEVKAKFTSIAMFKKRKNHPHWKCTKVGRNITEAQNGKTTSKKFAREAKGRQAAKLNQVTYYHFDFVRNPKG